MEVRDLKQALGIIETKGLVYTIACSDAALKAANIELLGYEASKGGACFVVKFLGNVGAVRAALDAASALAVKNERCIVSYAIPRPSESCWEMITKENDGSPSAATAEEKSESDQEAEPEIKEEEQPTGENPVPESDEETEPEIEEEEQPAGENPVPESDEETEPEKKAEPEDRPGICNLCNDPKCPRRKNEPHMLCIHYDEFSS